MSAKTQHEVADILIEHHRDSIKGCRCGWGMDGTKLGQSHAEHVAAVIVEAIMPTREQTAARLEDLHARWHDQPGNMFGRTECGWQHCVFYDAAEFALIQKGAER